MTLRLALFAAISFVAILALGACQEKKDEKFTYNYTENGCSTGEREFDSKEALCAALKDTKSNNGCAYNLRRERYLADCGSDF